MNEWTNTGQLFTCVQYEMRPQRARLEERASM